MCQSHEFLKDSHDKTRVMSEASDKKNSGFSPTENLTSEGFLNKLSHIANPWRARERELKWISKEKGSGVDHHFFTFIISICADRFNVRVPRQLLSL